MMKKQSILKKKNASILLKASSTMLWAQNIPEVAECLVLVPFRITVSPLNIISGGQFEDHIFLIPPSPRCTNFATPPPAVNANTKVIQLFRFLFHLGFFNRRCEKKDTHCVDYVFV